MKKYIAMAVAAGALAVGGTASAQMLGHIFGYGPGYAEGGGSPIVAPGGLPFGGQIHQDQYGRQYYYDAYGRQLFIQPSAEATPNYGITGYDAWGRPIYGPMYGNYAYANPVLSDRDGDGVPDIYDRRPDDPRRR